MFGDAFTNAQPAHELTYVPLYREPAPIPPLEERVTVPWKDGSAIVPTLRSFMRERVQALLGYTSPTLHNSRAYRALQTGWKIDDETGGLFPRPEDFEREMIADAKVRAAQFTLPWQDSEIAQTAAAERMRLELWIFDALNFIWQENDRGAVTCMPTTPPPPPGYRKPPITSGPGAMGLPR